MTVLTNCGVDSQVSIRDCVLTPPSLWLKPWSYLMAGGESSRADRFAQSTIDIKNAWVCVGLLP